MIIRLPEQDEEIEAEKIVICGGEAALAAFVQRGEHDFLIAFAGDSDFEKVLKEAGFENHAAQVKKVKVRMSNEGT